MLCAQYSYKMDIAVKKEEAFKKGVAEGTQQKAVEDALMLIDEYKEKPEVAAQKMNAPLELVLEALNKNTI